MRLYKINAHTILSIENKIYTVTNLRTFHPVTFDCTARYPIEGVDPQNTVRFDTKLIHQIAPIHPIRKYDIHTPTNMVIIAVKLIHWFICNDSPGNLLSIFANITGDTKPSMNRIANTRITTKILEPFHFQRSAVSNAILKNNTQINT